MREKLVTTEQILVREILNSYYYWISRCGRVWSDKKYRTSGRWLKQYVKASGHSVIELTLEGKPFQEGIHILVAQAFLGPAPLDKPWVLHKKSDRDIYGALSNHVDNLYYGNRNDNTEDRTREGKWLENRPKGSENHFSKLNELQVKEIKIALESGQSPEDLEPFYPVTAQAIKNIELGITWSHIITGEI